jgi:hypothetical protein
MGKDYLQLLRDPRWQKVRLDVFQRDGWTCKHCYSTTETLQVHHKRYLPGRRPPWESPLEDLVTLCEVCHQQATAAGKYIRDRVGDLDPAETELLVGILRGMDMASHHDLESSGPFGPVSFRALSMVFGLSECEVFDEIDRSPNRMLSGHRLWEMRKDMLARGGRVR